VLLLALVGVICINDIQWGASEEAFQFNALVVRVPIVLEHLP
jgi:hypothetical protein